MQEIEVGDIHLKILQDTGYLYTMDEDRKMVKIRYVMG